ncbi:salicylate hydroxylase [Bradyrhizobium algeriense]|uniref:Salicylate hydroxylase n=1 Tax=Bradyrhizobium algeriense TaxID=634784 RepID=A0ABU8B5G4_9BRAD
MKQQKITVIGAGIGGLAVSCALLQRGFDVEVYEQAEVLGEVGAGVQISANGAKALIDLGLRDKISAVACEAASKAVRIWSTGKEWKLFDLGVDSIERFGAPYWNLHRADLHAVLLEAVRARKADALHTGKKCVEIKSEPGEVQVRFADGSSATCDALVGADGVHSQIRQSLLGPSKAQFTGLMAWRGTIPMERLSKELRRPIGLNWIGPGAHVITYPIRSGELLNFVGIVERPEWQVESWSTRGTKEECAADFKGWHPLVLETINQLDTAYKWALCGREPLKHYAYGKICLIGDAAHPTLPFLAQGAVMALEDAIVLGRCFVKYPSPEHAFKRFEELRVERTSSMVRGASENASRFHSAELADPKMAENYVAREWQPERVKKRYDWLFEYDVNTVAV